MPQRYLPHPATVEQLSDDHCLLLNCDSGDYFALSSTAKVIWRMLLAGHPNDHIASALSEQFAVDEDQARKDIEQFFSELLSLGLIRDSASAP